jgi:hypothetical protein
MHIPSAAPVFAWAYLEDSPDIQTLARLLRSIPDEPLLAALRQRRRNGRNDYPVEVLWGVVLLTIALRHASTAACLAELRRNVQLRLLIGIETVAGVPDEHNVSRFEEVLGLPEHGALARAIFADMTRRLAEAVPTLGVHAAGDSTHLAARPARSQAAAARSQLPPPEGGRKEYRDDAGNLSHVVEWFGYKLHLAVDSRHEVVLAYHVTSPKTADAAMIPRLVDSAKHVLPAGRLQTLAYDKAADDDAIHAYLHAARIRPVIQMRQLWRGEPHRRLPGQPDTPVPITHDEDGSVWCHDPSGPVEIRRRMAYCGHESNRGTLKYRCPALIHGFRCGSERTCNAGKTYGLTLRVKATEDLRRFPPIPRATQTFERLYKGRTAVERVNHRIKLYWGADDGNVTGAERFHAKIGAILIVQQAFATLLASTPRTADHKGHTGLGPVQRALTPRRE